MDSLLSPTLRPDFVNSVLNIINSAILILDPGDRIAFSNSRATEMFGLPPSALLGQDVRLLFMPEDREILAHNIMMLTRRQGEFEGEAMLLRAGASPILGLISASHLSLDGHEALVFTIHDITHFKGLERLLRQSERIAFIGRILEDINHQIRNPISVIGGLARRLGRDQEDTHRYAEIIREESLRLENVLAALNLFMRLPRPVPRPVLLGDIMRQAREMFQDQVANQGCVWDECSASGLCAETVSVDLELLMQAIAACITNACESYANGSLVAQRQVRVGLVETGQAEHPYGVRISDRGMGMAPEEVERAVNHFYTRKTRHTGLGLTLAERVMLEQGGRLELSSEPGLGTEVTLLMVRERRRDIRLRRLTDQDSSSPSSSSACPSC